MLSDNISRDESGALCFAGQRVDALADRWGTPLYLMDENRIRQNCRMYLSAFRKSFGPDALPLYAGKAASFLRRIRSTITATARPTQTSAMRWRRAWAASSWTTATS